MPSQSCPRCGGVDRFYLQQSPRNGGQPYWLCSHCKYTEGGNAASSGAATPLKALTPDEIIEAHAGYAGAAAWCATALYTPAGAAALAYLYARGFTDETIQTAGLGYHPGDRLDSSAALAIFQAGNTAGYLGMRMGGLSGPQGRIKPLLQDVITIPYSSGGATTLLRTRALNSPKRKYSSPSGVALYAGDTPVLYGADLLATENTIILTEGEFKALAATQEWRAGTLSIPAVAHPGALYMPTSYLDALAHKTVYLCYDSEARRDNRYLSPGERATIANGEKLTGVHLPAAIARITAQLTKKYNGLTDDQKNELAQQLARLQSQLAAITARGTVVKVIRLPRGIDTPKMDLDTYLLESGPAALQSLINQARPFDEWHTLHGACDARYERGGVWLAGQPLANYQAVVAEDVILDDGANHTAKHRFDLWGPQGIMGHADIAADVWADPKKGIIALRTALHSGAANDEGIATYQAIKALSNRGDGPARRTEYTALGWQKIAGRWHYLAPDGSINSTGIAPEHRASLDPLMNGNHYALCGAGDAQAGAAAFRSLLIGDVCNQDEALLLASMAALALVHRFTGDAARPVFWPHGYTGNHKTSLVKVFLSLQGPAFTSVGSDGGAIPKWDSTAAGLELMSFTYRDALYCVDDYKQATTDPKVLARVLHNYSEGASRLRATASLAVQKAYPARGLMIATAEDRPTGDTGQLARIILYKHPEKSVKLPSLSNAQRAGEEGHLAAFWRGFIQSLAGTLDKHQPEGVRDQFRLLRDEVAHQAGHARTTGALAANRAAFRLLTLYMHRIGALGANEAAALVADFDQAARGLAQSQQGVMTEDRPGNVALSVLNELLASEEAYLYDTEDDQMTTAMGGNYAQRHQGQKKIGEWREVKGLRLACVYPDVAFALIQTKRAAQRQPINYTRAEIERQWAADGIIGKSSPGRSTYKLTGGLWVWALTEQAINYQNYQDGDQSGNFENDDLGLPNEALDNELPELPELPENNIPLINPDQISDIPANDHDNIAPIQKAGNSGNSGNSEKIAHSNGMNGVTKNNGAAAAAGNSGNSPATPPARPARRPQIDPMVETQKTLDIARAWIAQGRYNDAELKAYTIQMPEVKAALLAEIQQAQAGA